MTATREKLLIANFSEIMESRRQKVEIIQNTEKKRMSIKKFIFGKTILHK